MNEIIDFDNIPRLSKNNFVFDEIDYNKARGRPNEPMSGIIVHSNREYKFTYHHDFTDGNTYIVYNNDNKPMAYFCILFDENDDDYYMVSDESSWRSGNNISIMDLNVGQEFYYDHETYKVVDIREHFGEGKLFYPLSIIRCITDDDDREAANYDQDCFRYAQKKKSGCFYICPIDVTCKTIKGETL